MNALNGYLRISVCWLFFWMPYQGFAQPQSSDTQVEDLVRKMDALLWSMTNQGNFTMSIETQYWKRELEMDVSVLYNVDDSSVALIPVFRYSPGSNEDLQLRAGLQYFTGSRGTEFGELENLAFIELQWFY